MNERICANANALKAIFTLMVIYIHSFSLVPAMEGALLYNVKVYFSFVFPRIAVPMFFLYSGYFFFKGKDLNLSEWWLKIKRRGKTLLLPYIIWSLIGAVFFLLVDWKSNESCLNLLSFVNKTFWCNAYTPVADFPQWIGYEIPKITTLNMPLWYVRDLMVIFLFSYLIYLSFRRKLVSKIILFLLLGIFLFADTNFFHYVGIDGLIFFYVGAFLSYNPVKGKLKGFSSFILWTFILMASVFAYMQYGRSLETFARHWYIVLFMFGILMLPNVKNINSLLVKTKFGGGKMFFVYCSHIMVLRVLVTLTYRISLIAPTYLNFIIYMIAPLVCFVLCLMLYELMMRLMPQCLSILVGNRIK